MSANAGRKPRVAEGSRYLAELDGLRAIAILLVIPYHAWDYRGPNVVGQAITAVAVRGWVGVDVFFALSGFLITRILRSSRERPRYYADFYIRRALRIFPLYYAVLLLLAVAGGGAALVGHPLGDVTLAQVKNIWLNALYLSNFVVAFRGSNVIPLDISWSLAVEEQFYLLYPLFVRRLSRSSLELALVGAVLLAVPLRWLSLRYVPGTVHGPYALPYCRMDTLAVGALAALVLERPDRTLARYFARAALPLIALAIAAVATFQRADAIFAAFGYGLVASATAATLVHIMLGGSPWLVRLLQRPSLVAVGKVSYGLYLLHLFVRGAVNHLPYIGTNAPHRHELAVVALRAFLVAGGGLALAWLSWVVLERPFIRMKDRFAASSASPPAG